MNIPIIIYIQGKVLMIEGFLMLLPCLVSVIYREKTGFAFLFVGVVCILAGFLSSRKKPENSVFYLKEGCLTTALSWIVLSIFGCLPFVITREIPSFTDALFETVSGFTTTGASILRDVEALSHASLMWRSFTHWIGGMGVLVFLLAIVSLNGGSNFNLMRAESPGPAVGKLMPKLRSTAQLLYVIYFAMTVLQILILLISGMSPFAAVTLSFGTAGTGGFGILNSSIADYTALQQWIITIFMLLFGVNFNLYYLLLFQEVKRALTMEEVRVYFGIVLFSIVSIAIKMHDYYASVWDNLRTSAFQVASIITTTGYSTANFDHWPTFCKMLLVLLMFCGGCAGSTAGGLKVSRLVIGMKTVRKELNVYIHPKSVKKIQMDDKPIEHEVVRSTNVFFLAFLTTFVLSVLILSWDKEDFVTCFTSAAATINNVGPGLSMVGPVKNYHHFSMLSKYVMMFDMLAGRLELFPLLILFHPQVLKDFINARNNTKEKA